jgi:hypothetical protein
MTTTRLPPDGRHLTDGYQSLIAFAAAPDVALWEKAVTPPGFEGGDPVPTQTQHNILFRTKASRKLIDMTNGSFSAAYDPKVYSSILSLINVETLITWHFPNGATLDAYGYLKSAVPGPLVEGEPPELNAEIIITNVNPSTGAETAPVYTAPGTS